MLKTLRYSQSWLIKFVLGAMVIGLILYFGLTGIQNPRLNGKNSQGGVAATVNGEVIPSSQLELQADQIFESQKKIYQQFMQGNLPPNLKKMAEQQALDNLIVQKLLAGQAKAMGLMVSDEELSQNIVQSNSKNGKFNRQAYRKFIETLKTQYGINYESLVREDLLVEKLENLVKGSVSVTDEEVKQDYLLSKTELNLQKITYTPPPAETKPSSETRPVSRSNTSPETNNSPALSLFSENFEKEILSTLKTDKAAKPSAKNMSPLESLKKKYNLKVEETGFHSLEDRAAFTADPQAHEAIQCIFKLTKENPLCPKGYKIGNSGVFFKLIDRKDADPAKFDEAKKQIQEKMLSQRQNALFREMTEALKSQASIHINHKL